MSVIYSDLDALAEYVRAWKLDANNKKRKASTCSDKEKATMASILIMLGLISFRARGEI